MHVLYSAAIVSQTLRFVLFTRCIDPVYLYGVPSPSEIHPTAEWPPSKRSGLVGYLVSWHQGQVPCVVGRVFAW